MTDDLIGKKLGGYEIQDKLGQGGMATVYRARQTSMNRIVALKVLPRHLMRDAAYLQRFEREVNIVAQLEHRNIVPVHDYGEYDDQPYIAMRYMPAGSVDDLIARGPLELERALRIVEQIAPALDYAHSKNVLHRDLKPSNILLDDDGGAYLTDFGIARILGTEGKGSTITTQGVVGTPAYMSPEQAQGKSLDGRSDVYSLGVVIFEMLCGRRPFESETPYGVAVMQVTTQPPALRSINEGVSPAIERVVLKALKKQPENRYENAVTLSEALQHAYQNPNAVHDTQPRPIPVSEALIAKDPPASQAIPQQSPPQVQPVSPQSHPAMTPPPPPYPVQGASSGSRGMRPIKRLSRRPRRRSDTFWINVILGSVLGCGLLSALVVAGLFVVGDLLSADETSTPEVTEPPTTTPVFLDATPIPSAVGAEATETIILPTATFLPDFSVDSGTIIYFAPVGDNFSIFELDLQTGVETALTGDEATSSYPLISPDGTQMVFQSDRDGDFEIYVMDLASRLVTQMTDNEILDRLPAWSPDGRWIIYSSDIRDDGNYDLYRVPIVGGEPEAVFSNGGRNSHARYSHDGRYLVFTSGLSGDATTWEIVKLDLTTGATFQLTTNNVRDASPSFSLDDSRILFVTFGDGLAAIAEMDANGGEPTVLYDDPGYEWGMNYSPDGAFIFFHSEELDGSTLYMMRADGSDVRPIETSNGGFYPSWKP